MVFGTHTWTVASSTFIRRSTISMAMLESGLLRVWPGNTNSPASGLKQEDRLVGVRGLQNFEPGFLDHADRGHPDQGFVFDDEDHLSCRCICHDLSLKSPSCVPIL